MIGLDTNVIVRYLAQDDPEQSAAATKVFEERISRDDPGFVSSVALCEVAWVLSRAYKVPRKVVGEALRGLLDAEELVVEHRECALRAWQRFLSGRADFPDYLIGEIGREAGAATTLSFDGRACRSDLFSPP
ncbi:MAG: type II toxin-antitoxin system VapC family toxin [Kiritimatiellae bacterium]|nr:type II toxin-antitoxin system VapC family toxin [Kiritimatiellia bacterium]